MIELIKACGYRVFIRPNKYGHAPEYCFYTDGTRIAYAQWSRGESHISTAHMPNTQTGTGYIFANQIKAETLAYALGCHSPSWASGSDRASVKKWKDWNTFHQSSAFNSELTEV